ncbi:hypothetical protein FACS189459_4970 [Bacilli bacterium]|nr:hypothetical protein FACS189459_4970 [Bacilli bacterium]
MSVEILKTEIDRTNKIGCKLFILHPGNNQDKKKGIEQIAKAINLVNKSNKNVIICLETMAGKGSEIGSKLEELKQIIDLVDNKKLIGACIDTCHA